MAKPIAASSAQAVKARIPKIVSAGTKSAPEGAPKPRSR
jgi:hypothetical protein